ncbi:MAG: hypothetical protein FJW34_16090 [Acidobacteria bacterium]|nr:hypothetical protein [Acidobacteriota bacterium]
MITLAAVLLAVGAVVYALAVRPADVAAPAPVPARTPQQERLAALEEGLRDLEFEFRLGKLSEADYQKTRQEMEREMAELGKRPEEAPPPAAPDAGTVCLRCGARFAAPLRFCGECGQPMQRET